MSEPEAVVLKRCMLEASRLGCRVFRNHVGGFYAKDGSFHRTGLCKGSADLIGIAPNGKFLALEIKRKGGHVSREQEKFLAMVNKMGGIGAVVDDEKKIKNILDAAG